MKFNLATTAITLAIAAASTPALAQEADSDFNRDSHFNGPYVSIFGGITAQNNDRGDTLVFDNNRDGINNDTVLTSTGANAFSPGFCSGISRTPSPADGCVKDKNKAEYGIRLGWDRRASNFVFGGLLEVSKNESRDGTSGWSTTPATYRIIRELDYAVSARARAGFTPGGGALFYVTGGGSYAKIKHDFRTDNVANSFTEQRDGKMVWGWQAGGGTEVMLTDHMSLGLEYLYSRYRDNKYSVEAGRGSAPATNPFLIPTGGTNIALSDRNFDFHTFRATVGFQF